MGNQTRCRSLQLPMAPQRSLQLAATDASLSSSRKNGEAWLHPDPKDLASLYAVLDNRHAMTPAKCLLR